MTVLKFRTMNQKENIKSSTQKLLSRRSSTSRLIDPEALAFNPTPTGIANVAESNDYLPTHVNLLYEITIANTSLTSDVDEQFKEMLHKHERTFADDSTDIGYCPILEQDTDTAENLL